MEIIRSVFLAFYSIPRPVRAMICGVAALLFPPLTPLMDHRRSDRLIGPQIKPEREGLPLHNRLSPLPLLLLPWALM